MAPTTADDWLGASLLIADADREAGSSLASYFEREGFLVYVTRRGEEALRLARVCRLAVALIDTVLEDMAGSELAVQLRRIDGALPVIVTGRILPEQDERVVREAGIVHCAVKPVEPERLTAIAEQVLASLQRDPRRVARLRGERNPGKRKP